MGAQEYISLTDRIRVAEAAGFVRLGDCRKAEKTLDGTDPQASEHPAVLSIRLAVAIIESNWEKGTQIAESLALSPGEDDRELAGRFYLAKSRAMHDAGDIPAAAAAVRKVFEHWPEGQGEVLRDPRLSPLF